MLARYCCLHLVLDSDVTCVPQNFPIYLLSDERNKGQNYPRNEVISAKYTWCVSSPDVT
jgi:hypothetical protein